ncbi:hypothetical protein [Alteromonas flava]|uniref:hypothetical protein n=1 Tax=Alteromonas flava TaxID=2048003 RepID=UPI000C290FB0|nr:hypothetical protein [Alteromonas flava]
MRLWLGFIVLLIVGCGGGAGSASSENETLTSPTPPASQTLQPGFRVIMLGNSHSAANNLPGMIQTLIQQQFPQHGTYVYRVPQFKFLSDHAGSSVTLAALAAEPWTHVILQAQKYSQSFQTEYPINGALNLVQLAHNSSAQAIMFPEWAQVGRAAETDYIHNIHAKIATQSGACVAPIGYAWERALEIQPDLELHASDGNHAALAGSFLTALVMFEVITDYPADLVRPVESLEIAPTTQQLLGQVATYTIANHPACDY